jgi:hypothetical protein
VSTAAELQRERIREIARASTDLLTNMNGRQRMANMTDADRTSFVAMVTHIGQHRVDNNASVRQIALSDHYLWLNTQRSVLTHEIRRVVREYQELDGWLDIYYSPIDRLTNPDHISDTEEEDSEEDEEAAEDDVQMNDDDQARSPESPISDDEQAENEPRQGSSRRAPRPEEPHAHGADEEI